jgi:hypothetical protein
MGLEQRERRSLAGVPGFHLEQDRLSRYSQLWELKKTRNRLTEDIQQVFGYVE